MPRYQKLIKVVLNACKVEIISVTKIINNLVFFIAHKPCDGF